MRYIKKAIKIRSTSSNCWIDMDGLTLDQMAVFVAVVDAGSFSAAARTLNRAQSVITYTVQNLEAQTGTTLFDRSTYRPTLTVAGRVLLPRARRVLEGLNAFRQQTRALIDKVEPRLTLAVDVVVSPSLLTPALADFNTAFPMVEIVLLAQPMEATMAALRAGLADLGLIVDVPMPGLMDGVDRRRCGQLSTVMVAAPSHPLANLIVPVRREDLRSHTQLLLSSGAASGGKDWGAHAVNLWRVNDLGLRRALLLAGIGWSSMPQHMVEDDLSAGRLVTLRLDASTAAELPLPLPISVAHLSTHVLGPAGHWLLERLTGQAATSSPPFTPVI
jgi:DNA-binding transcriptional LysR family regulator